MEQIMNELLNVITEQNTIIAELTRQVERVAGQLTYMNNTKKQSNYKSRYGAAIYQEESRHV